MLFLNKLYDFFIGSRNRWECIQRDLDCLLGYDKKNLTSEQYELLYNVIHCGAYSILHSAKEYDVFYAQKYSELLKKYVPNINIEYPQNINEIYENFKEDILSNT